MKNGIVDPRHACLDWAHAPQVGTLRAAGGLLIDVLLLHRSMDTGDMQAGITARRWEWERSAPMLSSVAVGRIRTTPSPICWFASFWH